MLAFRFNSCPLNLFTLFENGINDVRPRGFLKSGPGSTITARGAVTGSSAFRVSALEALL